MESQASDTSSDAQQTVEKGIRAVLASSAFFKLDVWVIMDVTKYLTLPELLALARCCQRLRRVLVLDDGLWKRRIEIEFPSPLQRQQKDVLEIVEAKGLVPPSPPATVAGMSNRTQGPPSPTRTASVAATTAPPYHYEMYKTLFRGKRTSVITGGCNDDQPMFLPQYCDLLEAIRSDPPPQPLTTEELARLGTVRTIPVAQAALLNLSGEPHSPSSDKDQDERANANEEPDSEEEEDHNERPRATPQRVQPELLQRNQLMSFLMNLLGQHTDADDTDPSGDGEAD